MFDDPLILARLQFALTASTHYIFVAFTLGLAPFILFGQLSATLRRDADRMRGVRFWGGLYVVNYAMGVLSGLVMELQLALNWSGLSDMFGHVFGAPLAVETMGAFFVESTFLGLWIFGWDRMGRWAHLACFGVVTATAYLSAYWVLVSNGFLKYPVGFRVEDGTAVLTDPVAMLTNPATLLALGHIALSALLLGGAVVMAVSAYHLARRSDPYGVFSRGIRRGLVVFAAALMPTAAVGGMQFALYDMVPPTSGSTYSAQEIEAIEARYAANSQLELVGGLGDAFMMGFWSLMFFLTPVLLLAWLLRGLDRWRWLLWPLTFLPFLPYIASVAGWALRETGRQPWVVEDLLTTADAMTDMTPGMAVVSFSLFTLAFAVLATVTYALLVRYAVRGPDRGPLTPAAPEPPAAPAHAPAF
ncbi:cytochrome ubiquinol oxidase subunit I [Streptomonospora nanhaiensis]|uniref:Cytochrome d ubiquinol oxidase subunit I n=1 Tax=Streptomonospora nanhaiensis TaxID=1323731 RepID=A0A853BT99_9ACTN|nr:cytochrome ubiquinol oxidase subunit I [Streptomonospora nanhaiensis]MBV2365813.1 cytochrome ubiquinol oxidase subunit I [Streptomonospora nanhaiensis]MBX9390770.1 cytochrome ubiquinol oxidase subunit I [Streptomonospora nanhaiensis]NYI98154.1 cytochrome d ubiquinol oxidase subunit I [Streptomonospora nanhaiensis]